MSEPLIALVDMDNTLCDYHGTLTRDLDAIRSPGEPPTDYQYDASPLHIRERARIIRRQPDWWFNLPPIPSGFAVLELLKKYDYELHILSRSPWSTPNGAGEKIRWAQKHRREAKITLSDDKSLVEGAILFDDWPEYVLPWLEKHPNGLVLMPACPWNKDCKHNRIVRFEPNELDKVEAALHQRQEWRNVVLKVEAKEGNGH